MNILIWSCFWPFLLAFLFGTYCFLELIEAQKKEAPAKPLQGTKRGYPRSGPNRGGNKAIFPPKNVKKKSASWWSPLVRSKH
ncbi:hypothetical protein AB205_0204420 [Aquarana catesbeiana]|uniref:Uncharacterized protein n=1 Tax=Aquarana catesbeiana TaxID=8400 RepID=A0A2G9SKT4_AQUCT|nr:hypothetical protein AB205_0204420 [Aquarana catesbeiana]